MIPQRVRKAIKEERRQREILAEVSAAMLLCFPISPLRNHADLDE